MKIVLLSTSRADYSGLQVAAEALRAAGHQTLAPRFHPQSLNDAGLGEMINQLEFHRPELAVLHGDRWDTLLAATACTVARVPIAHIGGGDITTGSYDNRFRNAVTMLADWHLVATPACALQLSTMDIECDRVFVIGEPALDWLVEREAAGLSASYTDLERLYDLTMPYILINWQPETATEEVNLGLQQIIGALPFLSERLRLVRLLFIGPGQDTGAPAAAALINGIDNDRVRYAPGGLTRLQYAAAVKFCACMVGNSSSGLIEAPVFSRPFILVGDRQCGRPLPRNTTHVRADINTQSLAEVIESEAVRGIGTSNMATLQGNPYSFGNAGKNIVHAVKVIGQRDQM